MPRSHSIGSPCGWTIRWCAAWKPHFSILVLIFRHPAHRRADQTTNNEWILVPWFSIDQNPGAVISSVQCIFQSGPTWFPHHNVETASTMHRWERGREMLASLSKKMKLNYSQKVNFNATDEHTSFFWFSLGPRKISIRALHMNASEAHVDWMKPFNIAFLGKNSLLSSG